jgi:hypothetical protein
METLAAGPVAAGTAMVVLVVVLVAVIFRLEFGAFWSETRYILGIPGEVEVHPTRARTPLH